MATILEAAKWMREGREVKRASWPNLAITGNPDTIIDSDPDSPIHDVLEIDDLLADDWQLADPAPPAGGSE